MTSLIHNSSASGTIISLGFVDLNRTHSLFGFITDAHEWMGWTRVIDEGPPTLLVAIMLQGQYHDSSFPVLRTGATAHLIRYLELQRHLRN
jgi:hypothetical protein